MNKKEKQCTQCCQTKPLTEFYKSKNIYYRSECKECSKILNHKHRKKKQSKIEDNTIKAYSKELDNMIFYLKGNELKFEKEAERILFKVSSMKPSNIREQRMIDNCKVKADRIMGIE